MKEAFARTLTGVVGLGESPAHDMAPVDKLHAVGSSQIRRTRQAERLCHLTSLGFSLIALKLSNRPDEFARAIDKLAYCLTWYKPLASNNLRFKVARQAVQEHCIDLCPRCKGAGEIPAQEGLDGAQRMAVCPECGGHGKRRYTDWERHEAMELEQKHYHDSARIMADAMGTIAAAESEATRMGVKLLKNW